MGGGLDDHRHLQRLRRYIRRAVLLGVAEAPAFPASQKATGYWFPTNERSRSTAIFDSAAKFSNVIGVPLVAFAIVNLGWRWGSASRRS